MGFVFGECFLRHSARLAGSLVPERKKTMRYKNSWVSIVLWLRLDRLSSFYIMGNWHHLGVQCRKLMCENYILFAV